MARAVRKVPDREKPGLRSNDTDYRIVPAASEPPFHKNRKPSRIMSCFAELTPLLAPRSIAILGASSDPARIGGRPMRI